MREKHGMRSKGRTRKETKCSTWKQIWSTGHSTEEQSKEKEMKERDMKARGGEMHSADKHKKCFSLMTISVSVSSGQRRVSQMAAGWELSLTASVSVSVEPVVIFEKSSYIITYHVYLPRGTLLHTPHISLTPGFNKTQICTHIHTHKHKNIHRCENMSAHNLNSHTHTYTITLIINPILLWQMASTAQ